ERDEGVGRRGGAPVAARSGGAGGDGEAEEQRTQRAVHGARPVATGAPDREGDPRSEARSEAVAFRRRKRRGSPMRRRIKGEKPAPAGIHRRSGPLSRTSQRPNHAAATPLAAAGARL